MNVTAEFGGHQAGMHRARHHASACFIGDKNSSELLPEQHNNLPRESVRRVKISHGRPSKRNSSSVLVVDRN
jgi:hypothetical protein